MMVGLQVVILYTAGFCAVLSLIPIRSTRCDSSGRVFSRSSSFRYRNRRFPFASSSSSGTSSSTSDTTSDCGYKKTKHITFVSSNPKKITEVKAILGESFPWELRIRNIDLMEPQATPIEVSQYKCRQAAELLDDGAVIVEDTSLCFNALSGMPGPYIKWFFESLGCEKLARLLDGFDDKSAYAQCVLSYCLGKGQEVKTFVGSVDGHIVYPSGPDGFGWDPIFKPLTSNLTFAEMPILEKNKLSHRFKAFREFKAYVNSRTGS